jgi:hypothetical protein
MTNVACFCGRLYCFDGDEGPCPECGAVAVIRTTAIPSASENHQQIGTDIATAGPSLLASTPVPSGR